MEMNTASTEDYNVFAIVLFCILVCITIRHANDFYHGESVTLVPEGIEPARFRRDVKKNYLTRIEKDFQEMFDVMGADYTKEKDLISLEHTWCC
ncbi:unnamed protein product [Auanema sp. JU1783]|nr:unnamed protein product [Auanema sp. JU1783]